MADILYKVQIGAYAIKKNAEKQATRVIEKTGLKPIIIKSGILYKVQCGAFSKKSNAEKRKNVLVKAGFNAKIMTLTTAVSGGTIEETASTVNGASSRIRIWAIKFFDENESLYGDSTAIIEYDNNDNILHCVLIDTGMSSGTTVKKLKAAGVKTIDAVVISHAHGDHYGALTNVFKNFDVKALYLPDCTQLDKYQKSYGNAIRNQASKAKTYGATYTYLKAGSCFTVGENIRCDCIYQLPASAVSEHDNHHFVNNESIVTVFTLNGIWKYHTAGDLQNAGNNAMIKAVDNLNADIMKVQWHGDANATNEAIAKAVKPLVAFTNYHHKEGSGRATTRKRLEAVGTYYMRNAEDGDIYIDCEGTKMTVTCSASDKKKVFTK